MQIVFLWTDCLIWFLFIFLIIFIFLSAKYYEHWREAYRRILASRLAVVSMLILAVYSSVAILDSIHLQKRLSETPSQATTMAHYGKIESLLDLLFGARATQYEETYSLPLALTSLSKKTVLLAKNPQNMANFNVQQVNPSLEFTALTASQAAQKNADLKLRLWKAFFYSSGFILLFFAWMAWLSSKKYSCTYWMGIQGLLKGRSHYPLRTLLLTSWLIAWGLFSLIFLAQGYHVFGTGKIGQDIFYESAKSIRTGILIGTLTTMVMLPFACFLGTFAGYMGGKIDDVIQYIYTTLSSIPSVLLIAAAVLSLQIFISDHPQWFTSIEERADLRLIALCIILGVTSWTSLCRLLRAETLKLRALDYVTAARSLGASPGRIILRHIIPNVMHIVIIAVVLDFSGLVLAEAVLSYVGVGVDPSMHSWGNMINAARLELARDPIVWWPLSASFILMFLLVLAANLFADALRDAFDPRLN